MARWRRLQPEIEFASARILVRLNWQAIHDHVGSHGSLICRTSKRLVTVTTACISHFILVSFLFIFSQ